MQGKQLSPGHGLGIEVVRASTSRPLPRRSILGAPVRSETHRLQSAPEKTARALKLIGRLSVDYQRAVFRRIRGATGSRPVVVRTLEIDAKQHPRHLSRRMARGSLPFRDMRFSREKMALFRDQAPAFIRLTDHYGPRILLPMDIDTYDVGQFIEIFKELTIKHGPRRRPQASEAIETPTAVIPFDRFAEQVDFNNIGTNGLTQYLRAVDRDAVDSDKGDSLLHPTVPRTNREVAARSTSVKRPVSVRGEATGDPLSACLLAGFGVRQLSISAFRTARRRQLLRSVRFDDCQQLTHDPIDFATTSNVRGLLRRELPGAREAARHGNPRSLTDFVGDTTN